jgi:hypothetical protein
VGRFAFIGKSVRGRLTVSFHSVMGIKWCNRAYCCASGVATAPVTIL